MLLRRCNQLPLRVRNFAQLLSLFTKFNQLSLLVQEVLVALFVRKFAQLLQLGQKVLVPLLVH